MQHRSDSWPLELSGQLYVYNMALEGTCRWCYIIVCKAVRPSEPLMGLWFTKRQLHVSRNQTGTVVTGAARAASKRSEEKYVAVADGEGGSNLRPGCSVRRQDPHPVLPRPAHQQLLQLPPLELATHQSTRLLQSGGIMSDAWCQPITLREPVSYTHLTLPTKA